MHEDRRFGMTPVFSRVENIGANGGVHETPATWEATQAGLAVLKEDYRGEYRLAGRLNMESFDEPLGWM